MSMRVLLAIAAVVAMVAFTGTAMADPMTVGNYNFEANVVADGASTESISGWQTVYGTNPSKIVTYNPTSADFSSAGGNGILPAPALGSQAVFNSATIDNDCCLLTKASGANKTAITLDAGMQYTFTVAVGQGLTLHGAPWFGGFSFEVVDLDEGGSLGNWEFHDTGHDTPLPGEFRDYSVVFNADDYINDTFWDTDRLMFGVIIGMQCYVDNVRIDEHVAPVGTPEPSTLALLATGLIGLLAYAWRKRK